MFILSWFAISDPAAEVVNTILYSAVVFCAEGFTVIEALEIAVPTMWYIFEVARPVSLLVATWSA